MKKLLLFLLTLLMVFSMVGCKPKEPVIEEPQVVALTEEQAIEFVKGLPLYVVNLEKEPIYLSNENAYHNINFILELANISGGGYRGGSSTHTSSSGRSHGGGGRRL